MDNMKNILIIDDDLAVQFILEQFLQGKGFSTQVASDGFEALLSIEKKKPDLIITDVIMDSMDGLALIREVRNQYPDMPIIAISGGRQVMSVNFEPRAVKNGASQFLEKPVTLSDLFYSIQSLLHSDTREE